MRNRARINVLVREWMIYHSRRLSPLAESNPGMDWKKRFRSFTCRSRSNGLRHFDLMLNIFWQSRYFRNFKKKTRRV